LKYGKNKPLGKREYVPESCPCCREEWFERGSNDFNALNQFIHGINALKGRSSKDVNCKIEIVTEQCES